MISKCLNWQGNYRDKMKTRCQECGESTWSPPQHILMAEEGCTRQWSQMTGPRRRRELIQLSSLNFLWDLDWWDLLSSWFKYALIAVHKCVGRPHFIQYTIKNCCFFIDLRKMKYRDIIVLLCWHFFLTLFPTVSKVQLIQISRPECQSYKYKKVLDISISI